MNSTLFKLNAQDLARGLALAAIVAFLGGVQQGLSAHGFDFASYDWTTIVNVTVTAFIAYLGKNFLSTDSGKVLGVIG